MIMVSIRKVEEINPEVASGSKRIHLVDNSIDANRFGMMIVSVKPNTPPHVPYHFHRKKESAFFVVQGKAKLIVEGKDYVITPDTIVFIPPGEKHQVMNIGETEFKMIEVYSPLPLEKDNITVEE